MAAQYTILNWTVCAQCIQCNAMHVCSFPYTSYSIHPIFKFLFHQLHLLPLLNRFFAYYIFVLVGRMFRSFFVSFFRYFDLCLHLFLSLNFSTRFSPSSTIILANYTVYMIFTFSMDVHCVLIPLTLPGFFFFWLFCCCLFCLLFDSIRSSFSSVTLLLFAFFHMHTQKAKAKR